MCSSFCNYLPKLSHTYTEFFLVFPQEAFIDLISSIFLPLTVTRMIFSLMIWNACTHVYNQIFKGQIMALVSVLLYSSYLLS